MDQKVQGILDNLKGKRIGLFIDNANWFYPQKELGWKVSFSKLKSLFETYGKLSILRIYIGTPLISKDHKTFLEFSYAVQKVGFTIVTKPLKKIWINTPKTTYQYKCNFDVEIALDIARTIEKVDTVIIGSGDSDFLEVKKFALEHKKGFVAVCFEKGIAWEIRKCHHIFLEDIKKNIVRIVKKKPQHLRAGVSKTKKSIAK